MIFRAELVQEAVGGAVAQSTNATIRDFLFVKDLYGSATPIAMNSRLNYTHNIAYECYIPANIRTEYAQDIGGRTMRRKNGSICALDAIACVRFGFPCGQCTLVLPSLHIAHLQRIIDARMDRIEAIVRFVFLAFPEILLHS